MLPNFYKKYSLQDLLSKKDYCIQRLQEIKSAKLNIMNEPCTPFFVIFDDVTENSLSQELQDLEDVIEMRINSYKMIDELFNFDLMVDINMLLTMEYT